MNTKSLRFKFTLSILLLIGIVFIIIFILLLVLNSNSNSYILTYYLVAGFLGIIFITLGTWYLTNNIIKPIEKCIKFAQKIGDGDLNEKLSIDREDEFGVLATSLQGMLDRLKNMVEQITEGAEYLNNTSKSLSTSSKQLITASYHQTNSSEKVTNAINEIFSYIHNNTEHSKQAEQASNIANQKINQGSEASKRALNSMQTISEKILEINEIAFLTNILALNAAVEAAHAGEHGKGFSIVASEVKGLAERSKKAADEIIELSNQSHKDSEETGNILELLLPEIEKNVTIVSEIMNASIEQNSHIDQINEAVNTFSELTQQNSSNAKKIAVFSGEIEDQAKKLHALIQLFKTN